MRLKSGIVGYFNSSFGSTVKGFGSTVGAEKGSVTVSWGGKVTVRDADGKVDHVKEHPEDKAGVAQEIQGFAESLAQAGEAKVDPRQRPELAYNDLALDETPIPISFKV
ncbi:hypothetical protein EV426DRAFT_576044 [Tirmania nivea]|nr:hypothetical protein EV426DRAFT_576044 [Tirmania nivea]